MKTANGGGGGGSLGKRPWVSVQGYVGWNSQSLNMFWAVKSERSHSVTILEEAKTNKGNKVVAENLPLTEPLGYI